MTGHQAVPTCRQSSFLRVPAGSFPAPAGIFFAPQRDHSQPRRRPIHRDQFLDLDAGPHHRVLVVLDQHFRHQRAGVVGAGLHRAIGAGGHDRQEIAGLRLRQSAVEREVVAGFADRPDHVGQ